MLSPSSTRRHATAPVLITHPPPHSQIPQSPDLLSPPVPGGSRPRGDAPKSLSLDVGRPESVRSEVSLLKSPLQAEIERLTLACSEHERTIRAARNSIEHRLFQELPEILTRLNMIDDAAESLIAQILSAIQAVQEPLRLKLATIVEARKEDVETMRERTTPWQHFFDKEETKEINAQAEMEKIPRVGDQGTDAEPDGLEITQRLVSDIRRYLDTEVATLTKQLDEHAKRPGWKKIRDSDLFWPIIILIILSSSLSGLLGYTGTLTAIYLWFLNIVLSVFRLIVDFVEDAIVRLRR